jgi:cytochrome c oxidase subunit 2
VFTEVKEQKRESLNNHSGPRTYPSLSRIGLRIAGSLLLTLLVAASSAKPASPRLVEVTAKRYGFEPAEITVKKGEAIKLELSSADVAHGIRVRELKIELHTSKGKKADAIFTPQATGTFVGHCSVFCGSGHGEMTLTIHVVA